MMQYVKGVFCKAGFALIEVHIAVTIVSIVVVSIYSGVSTGSMAITQNSNLTKAIIIARSRMNEFRLSGMRGTDLSNEEVKEYPGFSYNRVTERYENPMFGPLPAKKTLIKVNWQERGRERNYSLFTVFFEL